MIKKYLGITLISASMAFAGCSSNDDDDGPTGDITNPDGGGEIVPDEEVPAEEIPAAGGVIEVPAEAATAPADTALSLVDTFTNDPRFSSLLAAVDAAGLSETLAGTAGATVFAPTNDVLAGVTLPTDQTELSELVQSHVVSGFLDGALVANSVGSSAPNLTGGSLAITADADGNLFVNGVGIVETDIQATNGIIHVIDGVIGVTGAAPAEEMPAEEIPAGETPVVPVGEDNLGASLNNLNASGFTDYVTVHNASGLGTVFDDNPWTAFIPGNDSIPDAALASDPDSAFAILNAHIITTGVIAFGDLSALGDTTTNSGLAVTFGGSATAPTVNGFTITEIDSPGTAALYSINGLLQ